MEKEKDTQEQEEVCSTSRWLQDNLRVIISIVIVVAIAGGIYSYSKRSQENIASEDRSSEEISIDEKVLSDEEVAATSNDEEAGTEVKEIETAKNEPTTPTITSKETEKTFIETAGKGDGTTHLARRALADYLEKNPDSELKAEHKIYIEDYMRKKVGSQKLSIGSSMEFSKDLIREAIGKSKELNEAQIKNLHKYAVMVPSLS